MVSIASVFQSLFFSLVFIASAVFLCLFTVRERLRVGIPLVIGIILLQTIVYYLLRVATWVSIVPFLAASFWGYCKIVDAQPLKLLYIMMVVIIYLLFFNTVFFVFEGSSYSWDWTDTDVVLLGIALSMPFMGWLLRMKLWPILKEVDAHGLQGLWTVPTLIIIMNVLLGSSHIQSLLSVEMIWPYVLLTTVFALSSAGVSILLLDILRKSQAIVRYEDSLRQIDGAMSQQAKRFAEITRYMNDIRILRHDLRHHSRILHGLLSEGRVDNAIEYLQEYRTSLDAQETLRISENFVGDIIGRHSMMMAKQHDIDVDVQCLLPADCFIRDVDLCVLLSNLMENAMHACAVQHEGARFIRATASQRDAEVLITIDNSCNPDNDATLSVSDSRFQHSGQGIPSIHTIARKYNGTASLKRDGNMFHAAVLLYKPSAAEAQPNMAPAASYFLQKEREATERQLPGQS